MVTSRSGILSPDLRPPMLQLPQPGSFPSFPSAFAAFASQLQSPHFQSLLQSQVAALQSQHIAALQTVAGSTSTDTKPRMHYRHDTTSSELSCAGIPAGSGGTSIHADPENGINDARRERSIGLPISRYRKPAARRHQVPPVHSSMLILIAVIVERNDSEEKARAQLLREMNTHVASTMVAHITKKTSPEPQKSPSASSSSSDTASSASSLFGPALPPVQPLSITPAGLPAPKPVKVVAQSMTIKQDATEVEDDAHEPTDLSAKPSAFATLGQKKGTEKIENGADQKPLPTSMSRNFQLRNVDERKINAQVNVTIMKLGKFFIMSRCCSRRTMPSVINAGDDSAKWQMFFGRYGMHVQQTAVGPDWNFDPSQTRYDTIAMMMLIDQIPSKIVDGHGFRSLMSFLIPEYPMPSAALFESTICPEVITQIQPHLATLFVANNPHANPFESLMQLLEKRQTAADDSHTVNMNRIASKVKVSYVFQQQVVQTSTKRDEDNDSSCCVKSKAALQPLIEEFIDYVGRLSFSKDELTSLLTVCHSVSEYFKDRPTLMSELSLTTPIVEATQPALLKDVLFVAEHAERINTYIRATPDMALLPISDSQSQTLSELIRLVQKI
ncbi:hypothetical protein KIN20_007411 [Parelaphostrongylus tenuis]|uniref:Uncharacterized protein n=1 Tax=Parelaphostrongylus tenuis TaxID=148309 RepID=A0AAD5QK12_PARTN|nr:hypothetical protein KIN20_007411 [Parelaphostrongylus tenuis]